MTQKSRPSSPWEFVGRLVACIALAASTLSCGPLREGGPVEGVLSVGEEYHGARERLLAAGALDITNIALFYAGMSPYGVARTKAGLIVVSSHLLVYSGQPSDEIRGWFLLPDNTCVSLFVRQGNAARIAAIEVGGHGKGFLPPEAAVQPENFSPAIDLDPAADGMPAELFEGEKVPDTRFWTSRIQTTVEQLRLDEHSDPRTQASTLTVGMPLRHAIGILAGHAGDDESGGAIATVEYVKGKYPRTIPVQRLYVLPGKTLVVVRAKYDPLAREQFTLERLGVGEPGVGYPAGPRAWEQKFTDSKVLNLSELVRRAGPLHFAALIGDLDSIQTLLREEKASINARDREGSTPLHLAARRGKGQAARMLLRSGADVNAVDSDGNTPLILVAEQGRPDLVALLLEHGAHASALNNAKSSAFLAAGRRGDIATVTLLLEKHHADANQADENDFTLLHRAASRSNPELARILLQHGANPNLLRGSNNITPLWDAIQEGALEVVRLLLDAGARVEPARKEEYRPLDAVAENGSVEIARMLIARGVKPDGPALYAASNSGHGPLVKLFLDHGADLQYTEAPWQRTVLHTAHSADVVKVLVKAGLDIEVKNKIGETPLHEAARFAPHEVVVALLELGADPHAVSGWNKTPLEMAEERDRPEKAEILQTLRAAMNKGKPKKPPPDKK